MKKTVKKVIAVWLCLSAVLGFSANALPTDSEVAPYEGEQTVADINSDFEKVLENKNYELYFSPESAEVSLVCKQNGYVWYSNPQNSGDINKSSREKSQIVVYYYENRDLTAIDSFESCVALEDKFSWQTENDKLTVSYSIGDDSFSADALPVVLSKERMEKDILSELSDDEKETVLNRYTLYSKAKLDENALKTIKLNFPSIEKSDLYIRSKMPDYIAEEIYVLFQKAGYTEEDLQRDCDENQIENTYKAKPGFYIELEYSINENGFKAKVDTKKIKYEPNYKPCRIEILPYFGAGAYENGYMIVPDGSGAVIEFNNGKFNSQPYWKKLFNNDNALTTEEISANAQPSVLPVFAISKGDSGFLASIDSGYEVAGVSADVMGGNNNYNYIHSFFDVFSADQVSLSNNEQDKFILTNEKILSCPIEISYSFLSGEHSYTDFALKYREILTENEILVDKKSEVPAISFDFLGTAQVTKRFFGVPYNSVASLTTYKQAYELIEGMKIENADVNFLDALKGGRYQKKADDLKLQKILGSKSDFNKLLDLSNKLSVAYYAQYAQSVKKSDSAITLSKSKAKLYNYDFISRYVSGDNAFNVISPSKLNKYSEKTAKSIKANKYDSVYILDLGYQLNSDFNTGKETDRYNSRLYVQEYLKNISKSDYVSVDVGSIFSLSHIDKINNIPVTSSGYHIEDYTIPFYQIVVSGNIPYSVDAINTASDSHVKYLKTVELGGQLHYAWAYEIPDNITQNATEYFKYLYKNTYEQAKEYYEEYSPLYNKIKAQNIVEHRRLSATLTKTVYANGVAVYVNYSDEDVEAEGVNIKAKAFAFTE